MALMSLEHSMTFCGRSHPPDRNDYGATSVGVSPRKTPRLCGVCGEEILEAGLVVFLRQLRDPRVLTS